MASLARELLELCGTGITSKAAGRKGPREGILCEKDEKGKPSKSPASQFRLCVQIERICRPVVMDRGKNRQNILSLCTWLSA